ncbi:ankyrin repeat-containing domain protein [Coprinopsis sp. MPI-PUGE-AT-0042]|nr:ankyrin repeat-containing domain protein [Coprinopsis sp. MPI-PUGE-AT-0042]
MTTLSSSKANRTVLTPLHRAIDTADIDSLSPFLESGIDYLEADSQGRTTLHLAIIHKSHGAVKALLAHRASASFRAANLPLLLQSTPSHSKKYSTSLAEGNSRQLHWSSLLKRVTFNACWPPWSTGAGDLDAEIQSLRDNLDHNVHKEILLHLSILDDKPAVFDMLLKDDADVNAKLGGHFSPHYTQALLENGADPNLLDGSRSTPLSLAVNSLAEVKISGLLGGGASPNVFHPNFGFPLSQLCGIALAYTSQEDPDLPLRILMMLLHGGADVNAQADDTRSCIYSRFGGTAMHVAAMNKLSLACFKEILLWGGNSAFPAKQSPKILNSLVNLCGGADQFMQQLLPDGGILHSVQSELLFFLGIYIDNPKGSHWSPWDYSLGLDIQQQACLLDARATHREDLRDSSYDDDRDDLVLDLTNVLLRIPETQRTGPVDAFVSILRTLDHTWPQDLVVGQATLSLGRVVKAWEGEGAEHIAQALLDVGADRYCPHHTSPQWFANLIKQEFGGLDLIALSAIYGRRSLVSLLLRDRPPLPPSPTQHLKSTQTIGHWLDAFDEMRVAHQDDSSAVLACLKKGGLLGVDHGVNDMIPLVLAVKGQDLERVRQLLSLGVDVERQDVKGWQPLHIAVSLAHIAYPGSCWRPTRSHSTQPWDNPWNGTPLHIAAVAGDLEAARLLLAFGADVHATTTVGKDEISFQYFKPGLTPLDIALSSAPAQ